MKKLEMKSPDLTMMNIEKIGQLFPNAITEAMDNNGNLKKAIDFDLLRQELSSDVVDGEKERYQLTWPGKKEAILNANTPVNKTLRPVKEDSVDWETTQNLYIEGDNLEVLKLLQESYLNKIKCIYIDPPYNRGTDLIYKDDFSKSKSEYDEESGQVDDEGNRLFSNTESNGKFHSDWLSMIYPRLKLARNLLKNDGVIFISIDDNEVSNLKKICDEIFGKTNFLGVIIWKKKTNGNNMGYIPPVHDYFICYSKEASDKCLLGVPLSDEYIEGSYSNPDNDPRGSWTTSDLSANHKGPYFPITNPKTGQVYYPPRGRYWVFSESDVKKRIAEGRIIFGKKGLSAPVQKKFLSERNSTRIKPESWWDNHGMNEDGTQELSELFIPKIFDHPKPSITLKHLFNIATDKDDIILDFFSGSGTSAHSVLELNKDGGKRKFILVQYPEPLNEDSVAFREGFKTISEFAKERIRRAAKKIKEETKADIDYGFRVFRVDSSNMKDVYYTPDKLGQQDLFSLVTNIKDDRTEEDLLSQIMLEFGLELSLPIETRAMSAKKVFFVAGNSLAACFEKEIPESVIREIAAEKPLRTVFRDSSFKNDAARINVEEIFKMISPSTEIRVI